MSLAQAVSASAMDDLLALSMDELVQVKVVTSTLTDESLRTVPASMTVFTREDIRRLGITHLKELVNQVPGLQGSRADDSVLSYSLSSRGRRVGSSGREILVLINGQRINNDWTGGAGQHNNLIPLENVERVEFVRGPGSALYGSNAMMGVINIITRSDRNVVIAAGEQGHRHASMQWRGGLGEARVEVYARDTRQSGDSLAVAEPFPSPATPETVDTRDPFRANDLQLRTYLGEWIFSTYLSSRDSERFYVAGYVDENTNAYDTRTHVSRLEWSHEGWKGIRSDIAVYHAERDLAVESAVQLAPYLLLAGVTNERELGTQWTLQGRVDDLRWLGGVEWRRPELVDTSYSFGPPENPTAIRSIQAVEDERYVRGAFLQLQQRMTDKLDLIAGARQDSYSDIGHHLSPRLGLVWQAASRDTFKWLYSEAFRAPSRIETSVISPEYKSNPDLKPEAARTGEMIWVHNNGIGYTSTTLFASNIENAIMEVVTPDLQRTWENDAFDVAGLEVEWQQRWTAAWQTRLALTHLLHDEGRYDTESDILLGGSVSYERNDWVISLLANVQGDRLDPNEQDVPADITTQEYSRLGGYGVMGGHVSHRLDDHMEIWLHVDNLFDRQYLSAANRASNHVGVPSAGRLVTLGLRWELD